MANSNNRKLDNIQVFNSSRGNDPHQAVYWLENQMASLTEIILGNDANYFFTSQLTGCRLSIVPYPTLKTPKIMHIDPNVPSTLNGKISGLEIMGMSASEHRHARNLHEQHAIGDIPTSKRVRRVTVTETDNAYDYNYSHSFEGAYRKGWENVIGIRDDDGEWGFFLQSVRRKEKKTYKQLQLDIIVTNIRKITWDDDKANTLNALHQDNMLHWKSQVLIDTNLIRIISAIYIAKLPLSHRLMNNIVSSAGYRNLLLMSCPEDVLYTRVITAIEIAFDLKVINHLINKDNRQLVGNLMDCYYIKLAIYAVCLYEMSSNAQAFTFSWCNKYKIAYHSSTSQSERFVYRLLNKEHINRNKKQDEDEAIFKKDSVIAEAEKYINGETPYSGKKSRNDPSSRRTFLSNLLNHTF